MALSVPSTTGSRQVAPDSGGDATSLTSSEDLQQLPLPVWKSGQLPGAGPSGGLGASKGSQQLAPGGPSWGGGLLSGIFNTSFFHDHEMCSEAASNIGRVAMPEQTARALAASSLLTCELASPCPCCCLEPPACCLLLEHCVSSASSFIMCFQPWGCSSACCSDPA